MTADLHDLCWLVLLCALAFTVEWWAPPVLAWLGGTF